MLALVHVSMLSGLPDDLAVRDGSDEPQHTPEHQRQRTMSGAKTHLIRCASFHRGAPVSIASLSSTPCEQAATPRQGHLKSALA